MAVELVDHWYPLGEGTGANEWQSNVSGNREAQTAVSVQSGDILIVSLFAAAAQGRKITASGGSLTWSMLGSSPTNWGTSTGTSNANVSAVAVFAATATSNTSFKPLLTIEENASSSNEGMTVKVFRGSTGVGATKFATSNESTTTPEGKITTESPESLLSVSCNDWNAGTGTAPTWSSTGAGSATSDWAHQDESAYDVYGAHFSNAGVTGEKTIKMSDTQRWQMAIVELKAEEEKHQEFLPDEDLATTGWTEF